MVKKNHISQTRNTVTDIQMKEKLNWWNIREASHHKMYKIQDSPTQAQSQGIYSATTCSDLSSDGYYRNLLSTRKSIRCNIPIFNIQPE
jgi:hypothetical protein